MDHSAYERMVPGSKTAVLMIHGIAGTPAHFRHLIPVIPAEFSARSILLSGHGGKVTDMGKTNMNAWKRQVNEALQQLLSQHEKVYLVAHSMGTLFALRAAVEQPQRIAGLFLLAVPTRPHVRLSTMATSLRVAWGKVKETDTRALAMRDNTSIHIERNLFKYLTWVPRFLELFAEIASVKKLLPRLEVPCLTFQSHVDELVSIRSCNDLENHPYIHNTVLYHSGHFAYSEDDLQLLCHRLKDFLK
ncbi:MAG: alpha/beta fold hydrolase [Ruminococcaceae bacterium]|nr:alpha/beta fold hydrolase [Oscillospiraceae bacterium]